MSSTSEEFFADSADRKAFEKILNEQVSYNQELATILFEGKAFLREIEDDKEFCKEESENIESLSSLISQLSFLLSPPRSGVLPTAKTSYLSVRKRLEDLKGNYDKRLAHKAP